MLSLTCPSVDLCQSGCLSRRRLSPLQMSGSRRRGGVRCMVSMTRHDVPSAGEVRSVTAESSSGRVQVSSLLEVVSGDMKMLNENLKSIIGAENPVLISAAEQIFGAGGKRLRPALVFLVSRATAQIDGISLKQGTDYATPTSSRDNRDDPYSKFNT
ncbi:trans-octaprenyltranstransferase [Musa troglodytarum]|uniref:Trans-octaprenyltranstransferase n=1 Tax=Musa troglodytarum TaxID=320322 RepID=A0A9E7KBC6_9LILI|nr:trans-octaprenyltranstransferase [Musa troglodytarum]